ncbi:Glycine cleavage system transcriptional activator [Achromobacter deleyi]|uniref:Glycine cleavage system transcriptional activator n=1 Tax=Achromobacter deleyi TaxID=1353891 RepID=A0A6S6ZLF0_9BURK|nr:LysR substrate-binding domain-containing protein [Achromobacter deleyi]CAB3686216.1 Glycine cleavage system transcriptional activator [Achromobacter deleyi]
MRLHSPSMSELHAFMTAARLGSFTLAADHLCVTQGAVSRAIARLEAHFGQPLMRRDAHGLTLTDTGRKLYEGGLAPLQAIEALSAELRADNRRLRLTLASVPTLASAWLVPRLPDFHRRHPDIQLGFAAYRRNEDFSGATPDAAILSGVAGQWPGWQADYVIGREMVVICSPARLATRRACGLWDRPIGLLGEPLLYHSNGPDNWARWFDAAGVQRDAITLASGFEQVSILVRAVMADMGIAVLQRCLVQDDLQAGHVVSPFPDLRIAIARGYHLCAPPQRRDHYALACFRDWLLDTARQDPEAAMP